MKKVGKYEVGRTIGEGTFAKVKFAINSETGECVALKVLAKDTVLRNKMVEQIKREVSIMKMIRHPNVVLLHEVLASQTKIYIFLEFVSGGELFDKIVRPLSLPFKVHQGRLNEEKSRRYFQQLIDAVDYCHSKGISHRDLKPENLLLDAKGNLKISDFGLSALPHQVREDGLLHTTCGTPNYVAPEVLNNKGYDGAAADIWSCGVILFVLMAGYLPFNEADLKTLYNKIQHASFSCPSWFSPGAKSLIMKILDPNTRTRITLEGIRSHPWFKKNYVPVLVNTAEETPDLDDVRSVFENSEEKFVDEKDVKDTGPSMMNAFELISLSQGLNLSALFDRRQDHVKRQTRFISNKPAKEIISRMEATAQSMGFGVETRKYKYNDREHEEIALELEFDKVLQNEMERTRSYGYGIGWEQMRLEGRGAGRIDHQLAVAIEVFQMAPSLYMIEVRKAMGDTLKYHKFYKTFCGQMKDITCKMTLAIEKGKNERACSKVRPAV